METIWDVATVLWGLIWLNTDSSSQLPAPSLSLTIHFQVHCPPPHLPSLLPLYTLSVHVTDTETKPHRGQVTSFPGEWQSCAWPAVGPRLMGFPPQALASLLPPTPKLNTPPPGKQNRHSLIAVSPTWMENYMEPCGI